MIVGGSERGRVATTHHAEDERQSLVDDLLTWIAVRTRHQPGTGAGVWARTPLLPVTRPPSLSPRAPTPQRLPRGRHGLPPGVIARSQRTRIIVGMAEVMMDKGFANTTVADIVAAAGVSREVFYEHFTDKLHAFLEAQRYSTQELLDACATAYFSQAQWPDRVWAALQTLIGLIVAHPSLSYLRLVECYAAGPAALSRSEDITRSFTVFLEEGFRYKSGASVLPRVYAHATVGAIFEVIYRHVARGESAALAAQLPRLAYVALAPFTGSREAIRLVSDITARDQGASSWPHGQSEFPPGARSGEDRRQPRRTAGREKHDAN